MNIRTIRRLSSCFRRGIETAYKKGLFREQPFSDFPNACCGDAPELLAQYLMDNDLSKSIKCKCVYGVYRYDNFENIFGHSWLIVDDYCIVDITADQRQFKNKRMFPQDDIQPCYVGVDSTFHSMFEIEPIQCRDFYGLQYLSEHSYNRMKALYDIIVSCIDNNKV